MIELPCAVGMRVLIRMDAPGAKALTECGNSLTSSKKLRRGEVLTVVDHPNCHPKLCSCVWLSDHNSYDPTWLDNVPEPVPADPPAPICEPIRESKVTGVRLTLDPQQAREMADLLTMHSNVWARPLAAGIREALEEGT